MEVENHTKWKETILLEGSLFHFPDYGRKGSLFDKGITLPETNIFAPENGWLEYDSFPFGKPKIFRCDLLVAGRGFQAENVSNQFSKMKL